MKLEFYYHKEKSKKDKVIGLIEKLKNLENNYQVRIIDISDVPREEVFKIYEKAWWPSVVKKYKIRKIFGSNRQPGYFFGIEPALFVYGTESEHPSDVYPHDVHGKIITIEDFLATL